MPHQNHCLRAGLETCKPGSKSNWTGNHTSAPKILFGSHGNLQVTTIENLSNVVKRLFINSYNGAALKPGHYC